jgi:hypothetical protein
VNGREQIYKGWIQTGLLCFAGRVSPHLRLSRRDGLAVHGIITAGVVGLLLYPASLVAIAWSAWIATRGEWPDSLWTWLVLGLTGFNISAVVVAAIVAGLRGLRAAGALHLAPLLLLPVYWAFMSFAAWQALLQFLRDPWRWEKTRHGVARDRRTPAQASNCSWS